MCTRRAVVVTKMYLCILPFLHAKLEGSSNLKKGLPEDCLFACGSANSTLEDVIMKLQKKKVTILDLEKIEKQQTQMNYLCEAASTQQNEVDKSKFQWYKTAVQMRIKELKCFKEQQGVLLHLCLMVHNVHGMTICTYVCPCMHCT